MARLLSRLRPLGVAACLALLGGLASPCGAQTFSDDFSGYQDGAEGWPHWEAVAVGMNVRNGAVEADGGGMLWREVPYASEVTFSCELTVDSIVAGDRDWATAGIGIMSDERNFWQVNLVRAPAKEDFRHFLEFQEMWDGQWLATGLDGSRLQSLESSGSRYEWQPRRTYTLEVTLDAGRISARVLDGQQTVARFAWKLAGDTPAVRAGRPALKASGMKVRFDNARATVTQTTPEPVAPRPQFPAWVSTGAEKLTEGTGFFATHQDAAGRWWLVDPEGRAFFDVGTDHCNYNAHWCEALGYAPYNRNVQARFGSPEAWAESATGRLKQWNFNTLAAGHHPATRHRGLAHILFATFGSSFAKRDWICEPIHWTGFPNVFSPEWERHCRLVARRIAKDSRGDPWCLGIFYDNELEWYGKKGCLVDELFLRAADHTGKQAFWSWLLTRYGDVAGVNRALKTSYANATAFLKATAVPEASDELSKVRDAFLAVIAQRYFQTCYEALRAADPQRLTLGARFAGRTPDAVLEVAGRYTDVFTINTYPRIDLDRGQLLDVQRQFRDYYAKVQKPFAITEWSFPALDSGLPCKHGAGLRVDTQAQKARCYEIFAQAMIDLPFIVGYHYFMWVDEPAQGISSTFPEDSNYGLVDVNDKPYTELVEMATRVNAGAHQRHKAASISGDLVMSWQEGKLQLRNDTPWPATGKLTALIGGRLSTSTVTVPAGQTLVPKDCDWSQAVYVLLEEWDGTVTRIAPPGRTGAPAVINAGTQTVQDIPVIRDGQSVSPVWLPTLAPGQTMPLGATAWKLRPDTRLEYDSRTLKVRAQGEAGHLLDTVVAQGANGSLPLGHVDFATHQIVEGRDYWVASDTVEERQVSETPDGVVMLEATVACLGDGQPTGPARFRARVRAVFFPDRPVILVRPLWVESLEDRPWELSDCFVFCRPAIGGDPGDDRKGGPDVPNYHRRMEYWTDAKSGGAFGAVSPDDSWKIQFWMNESGGFHPDARREVNRALTKGQRWTADGWSYLWLFALSEEAQVNEIAAKAKLARDLIVTGQ